MPLFMHIHKVGEFSDEDIQNAHRRDLAVQKKYGVKYLQYWFSKTTGTVYYLIEGPDKESCAAAHRETMGITECQIEEVEGGKYDHFMEEHTDSDVALSGHKRAKLDAGYRFILTLDIISKFKTEDAIDFDQLKLPASPTSRALKYISEYEGKEIRTGGFDKIAAVFESPENILRCAQNIQNDFLEDIHKPDIPDIEVDDIVFYMGISVDESGSEQKGHFENSMRMSQRFCMTAWDFEIITSKLFDDLCDVDRVINNNISLRIINPLEQEFLSDLVDIIEDKLSDDSFGVDYLSHSMGVSQPQLYRKVFSIAGRSPVFFIREIRLNKSLSLIKENKYNLSEIALEVGFNSPSYFSKCFQEKFGVNASKIVV